MEFELYWKLYTFVAFTVFSFAQKHSLLQMHHGPF